MKNRAGSYKKILIDLPLLQANKDYLAQNLKSLNRPSIPKVDLATLYILLFLRIKHPKNWLQKFRPIHLQESLDNPLLSLIPDSFNLNQWEKEKLKGISAQQLFSSFHLKGIPQSINRTMLHWYQGQWNIEVFFHIPSSRELLKLQAKNIRCVTLILDSQKIDQYVLASRDPLSFLLHDLMHADHFFGQKESLIGQLGFYQLCNNIYDQPLLKTLLKSDIKFKTEFEYVVSDMNAYAIHLFKCLKSSITRTRYSDEFFEQLLTWWSMTDEAKDAARKLNTPHFNEEDEIILKTFFEGQQEIYQ